jgi:mRNA interferase MazF
VRRGDLITVSAPGDYGKPRPALVMQSDLADNTESITLLMLTSRLVDESYVRHTVQPTPENGLLTTSQVQIDKLLTVHRSKVGRVIGRLDDGTMVTVTRYLAFFLGIA